MNKKAQMICIIPSVTAGAAVMIWCFASDVGGNQPLLYCICAMAAVFLVMYLLVGRRMSAKEEGHAEGTDGDQVNLKSYLNAEEIRILLSDLQAASDKVPFDQKAVLSALSSAISGSGTIHRKTLPVCVSAVEMALGVFSAFGMVPAGHSSLLDKLKNLEGGR